MTICSYPVKHGENRKKAENLFTDHYLFPTNPGGNKGVNILGNSE